jgi:ketosteroid isomerase-like protein
MNERNIVNDRSRSQHHKDREAISQNTYCWVFRFGGDKVIELIEYADTALMECALQAPRPH